MGNKITKIYLLNLSIKMDTKMDIDDDDATTIVVDDKGKSVKKNHMSNQLRNLLYTKIKADPKYECRVHELMLKVRKGKLFQQSITEEEMDLLKLYKQEGRKDNLESRREVEARHKALQARMDRLETKVEEANSKLPSAENKKKKN